jgi:WD40 repeat protein
VLLDPVESGELGKAVAEEAERATGVLWFHYVGHGLVSVGGHLHLATGATRTQPGWLAHTALSYGSVRESLLLSKASALVVTLDCCFSGRAVDLLGPDPEGLEVELARISGGFVLAAAAREEVALAPTGAVHTAFSGELIRLLRQGDPQGGPRLTLLGASRSLQRSLGERGFPVPRELASGTAGELMLCSNPAYRPPAAEDEAAEEVWESDAAAAAVCPYPGLMPFGPGQAQWYFGRAALLKQLTERVSQQLEVPEPLMVIGPSGAGKSSLLGAGLLPAFERGDVDVQGSADWPHAWLTPTDRPLTALASALSRLGAGGAVEEIAAALAVHPERVCDLVADVLAARAGGCSTDQTRWVVVVDQFEEAFALCEDDAEQQAFLRALTAAAQGRGGVPCALVVIGVRADFYADCLAQPGFRQALEQAVVVGPLTASGLAEAITEPAGLCRLKLQAGLVELMLRDLGMAAEGEGAEEAADAGALPLLAHALRAVWERREGRTLTLAGYREAGGVHGAIAATAEACYKDLGTETLQKLARTLVLGLIQVGDKSETSRRVRPDDLLKGLSAPDASLVLEALTEARLVTRDTYTVELAHEVLIRAWPRLRAWVKEDRAGLLIHQGLAAAAAQWDAAGRPDGDLRQQTVLLGEELAWAATAPAHLRPTAVEQDFLDTSVALGRRRARRRRVLRAVVGGLSALALIGGLLAWQRSRALETDRLRTAARNIAARADTLRQFDPQAAMLLNIAAWKTTHVAEARSGLLSAMTQQEDDTFSLPDLPDAELRLSENGRTIVSADDYGVGMVRVWDTESKRLVKRFDVPVPRADSAAYGSALSPDGRVIAVQSGTGIQLWETSTGKPASAVVSSGGREPLAIRGTTLVLAAHDHVEVWDTRSARQVARIAQTATDAELSGTGRVVLCDRFASSGRGSRLALWNARTGRMIGKELSPGPGNAVCDEGSLRFSPDGSLLAAPIYTSRDAGEVRVWNAQTAKSIYSSAEAPFTVKGPGLPFAISVAFSPDGKTLAVADDESIVSYRIRASDLLYEVSYPLHSEGAEYLVFAPDGRKLKFLRGSDAGTAVRSIRLFAGLPRTYSGSAAIGAISADGTVVAAQRPNDGRNEVGIVDGATGKATGFVAKTLRWPNSPVNSSDISSMALSGNGEILVVSDPRGRTATVWNTRTRRLLNKLTFSGPINQTSFKLGGGLLLSADGTVVAATIRNGRTFEARNVVTSAVVSAVRATKGQPLAISSDGHLLVTDAGEIIDVRNGRRRYITLAHYAAATQAAFSPDGRFLAATDYAGGLALWNAQATKLLTYLNGGSAYSYGHGTRPQGGLLAFSVNGNTLAVQHPLKPEVQLWDTLTLRHIGDPLPLGDDLDVPSALAFGPHERDLRAVGTAGFEMWEDPSSGGRAVLLVHSSLDPDSLVRGLCARAGRNLTKREWQLYVHELPYRRVCP